MLARLLFRCFLALSLLSWATAAPALAQEPRAETSSPQDFSQLESTSPAASGEHKHEQGEHAHDHAAHIGAEGVDTSPTEVKQDLAVWSFVVFLLLLGILWKFAWGPIVAGLEKREHGIAEQIAAAQRSNEEAKLMLAQYERKLASSADEVRAIIDEARRDAEHTQQEILAKARADAQAEKDRGLREIETATNQALKQLAEHSANLAVDLAGKIVQVHLKPADHTRLIEEAMARFPQGTPSKN